MDLGSGTCSYDSIIPGGTVFDEQHVWWHACIRVCTVLCYSMEKAFMYRERC